MVLQPMGCGRVDTATTHQRKRPETYIVSGRFTALPNAISALPNAFFPDVTLRGSFTGQTERPGSPAVAPPDVQ